jgi:hypothetical protein
MIVIQHVPFNFRKIVTCYADRTYKELINNMFNNQTESKPAAMNILKRSHGCYHRHIIKYLINLNKFIEYGIAQIINRRYLSK